jgi:ribosomal protein L37AE/L43A
MKAKVTCPRCQFAYPVVPWLESQVSRCPRCELRIRVRGLPPRRLQTQSPDHRDPIECPVCHYFFLTTRADGEKLWLCCPTCATRFANPSAGVSTDFPRLSEWSARKVCGILLLIVGVGYGGMWTMLLFVGESLMMATARAPQDEFHTGTTLTVTATVFLIVAGLLLLVAGKPSGQVVIAAGKKLASVAIGLTALAAAVYVFGFLACCAHR